MTVGGKPVKQFVENFSQGPTGEAVALVGSSGFIEIAVNKGNAARALGCESWGGSNSSACLKYSYRLFSE